MRIGFVCSNKKAVCIKVVGNIARSEVLTDSLPGILGLVWLRDAWQDLS